MVHLAQNRNTKVKNKNYEVEDYKKLIKNRWRHIIYISSINVYGIKSSKYHEPTEKVFSSNNYTKTKIACEELTRKEGGTILRFSNLYGHNMHQNTIIGTLIEQLKNDGPIVLNETKSVRDFLWIDDAIESILLAIKYKPDATLNVGTGKGTSIKELIKLVLQLINTDKRDLFETFYFFWSIFRSRKLAKLFYLFFSLILNPFDRLADKKSLFDAGSGSYFLGRKSAKTISQKEVIKIYGGMQQN